MQKEKKPVGRPPLDPNKQEVVTNYTVSLIPSSAKKLREKYGSLTKAIRTLDPKKPNN